MDKHSARPARTAVEAFKISECRLVTDRDFGTCGRKACDTTIMPLLRITIPGYNRTGADFFMGDIYRRKVHKASRKPRHTYSPRFPLLAQKVSC